MDINQLLKERGEHYGDTHYLVGIIIGVLREPFIKLVLNEPELIYDWTQMMGKLVRIVFSPKKLDHYDDLIGYATLAKGTIERKYRNDASKS